VYISNDPSLEGPLETSSMEASTLKVTFYETPLKPSLEDSPFQENMLIIGKIPISKIVLQAITQTPLFYPPPSITTYLVVSTLNFPNTLIIIQIWYLDQEYMILVPSLLPQLEVFPTQFMVQTPTLPIDNMGGGNP